MKHLIAATISALALILSVTAPAHARDFTTYVSSWLEAPGPSGSTIVAIALHSGDPRCTTGRTVRYEIQAGAESNWQAKASEVAKYSEVAGLKVMLSSEPFAKRVVITAKTLADGTLCKRRVASPPVFTQASQRVGALPIGAGMPVVVHSVTGLGRATIAAYLVTESKCRDKRTVRFQYRTSTSSSGPWMTLGYDVTTANTVVGIGGPIPDQVEKFRVKLARKTLSGGAICNSQSIPFEPGEFS